LKNIPGFASRFLTQSLNNETVNFVYTKRMNQKTSILISIVVVATLLLLLTPLNNLHIDTILSTLPQLTFKTDRNKTQQTEVATSTGFIYDTQLERPTYTGYVISAIRLNDNSKEINLILTKNYNLFSNSKHQDAFNVDPFNTLVSFTTSLDQEQHIWTTYNTSSLIELLKPGTKLTIIFKNKDNSSPTIEEVIYDYTKFNISLNIYKND